MRDLTLPTIQDKTEEVKADLIQAGALALLFIDASRINKIEQNFGKDTYRKVLDGLTDIILNLKKTGLRKTDQVTLYGIEGEQFLVFLSRKREGQHFQSGDLENLVERVSKRINKDLVPVVAPYQNTRPRIGVGHGIIIYNPLIQEERQIYKLIEDARQMSAYQYLRQALRNKEKVQELIIKGEIRTHFQPIVSLNDFSVHGYEALSRGPAGTEYEAPNHLFSHASEAELIFELDRLCREKAFKNASRLSPDHRLFLNCLPATIHDPGFKGEALKALLDNNNLPPSRVVMEISEKDAIDNYALFKEAVDYYTDLGFGIAVDDTGSGHSSLETVVELKPMYLKLDISLVRDIQDKPVKQDLLKAILSLAKSIKSQVIAEGIEKPEELETLKGLGVELGQGFLIAEPSPDFVIPDQPGN